MSAVNGGAGPDEQALMERVHRLHLREPHPELTGARLRLHLAIHLVVERQLEDAELPEARGALRRLVAEGLDEHEARHAIGTVVAEEILGVVGERRAYDDARYRARLQALSAEAWRAMAEDAGEGDAGAGDQGK